MRDYSILLFAFACAGFAGSSFAAPTTILPRTVQGNVPSWTCVEPAGSDDATPVRLVDANAACLSSNGGLDCDCVRFRDLLPAIWRLWLREPGIVVLTALSGNLSGNGLARPSSLPESVLFECSVPLAATTSPAENKLGTRATFCNSLPGQKILVNIVFNYGVGKDVPGFVYSVDSGDCYFVTGDSLPVEALVYRSTGSRSYTAVAWLLAKNPTTGYPKAAVTDLTYRDDKRGGNCYPDYPDYMEYGFKEGEQHDFYKYGHYQVVVRRDTDTGGLEGAKQFHFDIQILEGGITLAGSCPNIHPTMEYRF